MHHQNCKSSETNTNFWHHGDRQWHVSIIYAPPLRLSLSNKRSVASKNFHGTLMYAHDRNFLGEKNAILVLQRQMPLNLVEQFQCRGIDCEMTKWTGLRTDCLPTCGSGTSKSSCSSWQAASAVREAPLGKETWQINDCNYCLCELTGCVVQGKDGS